jgi:hypothetical protein
MNDMTYQRIKYTRKNGKVYGPNYYREKWIWDTQKKYARTLHVRARINMPENRGDSIPLERGRKSAQDALEGEKHDVHRLYESAYPPEYRKRWDFW